MNFDESMAENVKFIKPGQRVVPDMGVKCGVCKACRSGRENRCQNPHFQQFGGGFADYVRVPEKNVHIIKQASTSLKAAAFTEPLSCVVRGQNMLRLYPGEVELVAGLGPIGLMHLQVAKAFGARVLASDPVQRIGLSTRKKPMWRPWSKTSHPVGVWMLLW